VFVLDDDNIIGVDVVSPTQNAGRVIMLPSTVTVVNKTITSVAPATEGFAPFLAPIAPSAPPALPGRSASLVGNLGALTAPGVLVINGDICAARLFF
jgi:hypothetical protein